MPKVPEPEHRTLTVQVPEWMAAALDELAKEKDGLNKSVLLRLAIQRLLKSRGIEVSDG